MNLFGYSVLLMLWGYCRAQGETCDYRKIENGRYYWSSYDRYPDYYFPMSNGKQVSYICNEGFATSSGSPSGEMTCTFNGWSPAPKCLRTCAQRYFSDMDILYYERSVYTVGTTVSYKCHKGFTNPEGNESGAMDCLPDGQFSEPKCTLTGRKCGPAPPIANGDVVGIYQQSHNSGTSVTYKCQYYHIMEGSAIVTCRNGEWTTLPYCLEPCTTNSEEMVANKLQLRFLNQSKVYIKHGDTIEFICIDGYKKVETMEYRVQCNRGKLTYPKCISPA